MKVSGSKKQVVEKETESEKMAEGEASASVQPQEQRENDFKIPQVARHSLQSKPQDFNGILTGAICQEITNSKIYHDMAFLEFLQSLMEIFQFCYFVYIKKLLQHIHTVTVVRRQVIKENPYTKFLTSD